MDEDVRAAMLEGTAEREVFEIACASRTPLPTEYLIFPYLPRGEVTWFEGQTKTGKTTVAIDIAARLSRGDAWLDGSPIARGRTAIITCEDDIDRTIIPRLHAARADLDYIGAFRVRTERGESSPSFAIDLSEIEKCLCEGGHDLLIVDGTFGLLGVKDGNSYTEAYAVMTPVVEMVRRTNVAAILIRHVRKTAATALNSGLGSVGYASLARSSVSFAIDREDRDGRLMAHAGVNSAREGLTYRYRIVDGAPIPGFERPVGAIEWGEAVEDTADEIMAAHAPTDRSESEIATDWLIEHLGEEPQVARDLRAAAEGDGIAPRTLQRVARSLGVTMVHGNQRTPGTWALPLAPKNMLAPQNESGASASSGQALTVEKPYTTGVSGPLLLAPMLNEHLDAEGCGASTSEPPAAIQPSLLTQGRTQASRPL